ncbi:MAG: hypothetical protein ACRC62_33965 [Microcoleus sp.]
MSRTTDLRQVPAFFMPVFFWVDRAKQNLLAEATAPASEESFQKLLLSRAPLGESR